MHETKLPKGFRSTGQNIGIKNSKPDCGLLLSSLPCVYAACVTQNKSRAANTIRLERLRDEGAEVRAVLTLSGNANALTGAQGVQDDLRIAERVAEQLGIEPEEVLTAYTGVVGHRLPVDRVVGSVEALVGSLTDYPAEFAKSVLTTDKNTKFEAREIFVGGRRVQVQAVAKGSGMIAPALATTLVFVTTDAVITRPLLQRALSAAVDDSINQLTVDQEMSTNDAVVALANGRAENPPIEDEGSEEYALFAETVQDIFLSVARAIADDGEGATRRLEVSISGAASRRMAQDLARSIAGSMLVKAAVFGADPNMAGRVLATAGASATRNGHDFDLSKARLVIEGRVFFEGGAMVPVEDIAQVRHRLAQPVLHVELGLDSGDEGALAFGCDLSYDYVKINADYAAITQTSADGRVAVTDRLAELGPSIKRKTLVEALRYIEQFRGMRAVVKLGGAAMLDPKLEAHFAEDVLLLQSVGLRPVVVHGGGPEISRTMERMGQTPEFVDGLRVTNHASMSVVEMVLTGSVNQRLVAALNRAGSKAVGLSGKDGGLIRARRMHCEAQLGQVGEVESIDTRVLDTLEREGYVPVVSPIGLGEEGVAYNLNADVVAAELATALEARKLIFLSDVAGLMEGERVVSQLNGDQLKRRLDSGQITGPMFPKLEAALRALRGGLSSVHLVDGRVQHNLIAELFTDRGVGTLIRHA